jgi:hypothetical protein
MHLDRLPQALEALQRALAVDPKHEPSRDKMRELRRRMDQD